MPSTEELTLVHSAQLKIEQGAGAKRSFGCLAMFYW
jgi:hypothetical protein